MRVSIGLPFYNAENFLADAIRSVFAQTVQDWELILVDDGSTDSSLSIAMAVQDPRVRVISDGRNLKLAARLNQIVDLAMADIVCRMDADDLMSPDRLERQLEILDSNPSIDLVSTGLVSLDSEDQVIGFRSHYSTTVTRSDLLRKRGAGIVHASVLGRTAWFRRNRYNANVPIAQDYDLWLRASASGDLSVRVLCEPLYYVRELQSVTPKKMFNSYKMDRRAILRSRVSIWELRFVLKSVIKTMVLHVLVPLGLLGWLVRRRSVQSPSPMLLQKVSGDIKSIRMIEVSGLVDE